MPRPIQFSANHHGQEQGLARIDGVAYGLRFLADLRERKEPVNFFRRLRNVGDLHVKNGQVAKSNCHANRRQPFGQHTDHRQLASVTVLAGLQQLGP